LKILRGGSAEVKPNRWFKFDIELDESDLQAIVVKNSIDGAKLSVVQKYQVLVKQAELLTTIEMEAQEMLGKKSSRELIVEFTEYLHGLPKLAAEDADRV
jgi:hypothetical protein